jgi:hypothetical protein
MIRLVAFWIGFLVLLSFAGTPFAQAPATQAPAPAKAATQPPPTEPPPAQPTLGDDKDAIDAGKKWLELLDADKSGVAWDSASKQLQSVVKREAFIADVRNARKPLGKLESRSAVKFARAHQLPGAPAGDYTIIEFEATYAGGKHLSEQVIWTIEEGDVWRVAGYFYR